MKRKAPAADMLRMNEQLKATSTVIANLGAALFIAAVARWFDRGVDPMAVTWMVAAAMIIWGGINLLADLEAENGNG